MKLPSHICVCVACVSVPLAFLIFSPPLWNFHVVLPTKFVSFVFYLSLYLFVAISLLDCLLACRLLSPFGVRVRVLVLSLCLSFSFSVFQIYDMTINLSWSVQRHWDTSRWVWDKDWWKCNSTSTPRQIPYMIKDKKKRLNYAGGRDGHYHQGWPTHQVVVNPIVVVRKSNGDVRICLDPVDLNKAVKRELTLPLNDGGRGSRKYVRSESFLNRWCNVSNLPDQVDRRKYLAYYVQHTLWRIWIWEVAGWSGLIRPRRFWNGHNWDVWRHREMRSHCWWFDNGGKEYRGSCSHFQAGFEENNGEWFRFNGQI